MENGFSSPSTDEPLAGNPRVHEAGRQNYERNNKSSDWFGHSDQITDVKPESRLRSDAARANAQKNRGSIQEDLNQNHTGVSSNSHNGKLETPEIVDTFVKEDISNHYENHSNNEVTTKTTTKPQKEKQREVEQSSSSVSVSNGSSSVTSPDLEQPPATPPRSLELSGKDKTEKKKGGDTVAKSNGNKTPRESKQGRLHQESTGGGWDQSPPHQRLRADGEDIARKSKTDSVTEIFSPTNSSPEVREPKVIRNIPEPISYTPRKPPTPRVRPEGLQNLQKAMNHSEMSAIMHGSPVESQPPRPSSGRKHLPHMQRSELW